MKSSANNIDELPMQSLKASLFLKLALQLHEATPSSKYFSFFLYICSQLQNFHIISKSIIFSFKKEPDQTLHTFEKIHESLFWENVTLEGKSSTTYLIFLSSIGVYFLLVMILFCCLLVLACKNHAFFCNMLYRVLAVIVQIHPFVCFYFIHIASLVGLRHFYDEEVADSLATLISKERITILGLAVIILNVLWVLAITFLFTFNVKNRDILSTKTNLLNLTDLSYKFILPLLWSFANNSGLMTNLILAINMVFCLAKNWMLFQFLPYYELSVLNIANWANCFLTSLVSAAICIKIIGYCHFYPGSSSLLLWWLFIFVLALFILRKRMQQLFIKILFCPKETRNPYHLMHFMEVYKLFARYSASGLTAIKVNENYLSYVCAINQSDVNYLLPSKSNRGWTAETQNIIDNYFMQKNLELLETYSRNNPRLTIFKLTLARYYVKSERSLVLVNYILDECLGYSSNYKNSIYLIKMMMLSKLRRTEVESQKDLNTSTIIEKSNTIVRTYVTLQGIYERIKEMIKQQIALQEEFWKDFQTENINFLGLYNKAQKVYIKSNFSKRLLSESKIFLKYGFSEPFLTFGLYFCFVQNDYVIGQKFFSEYWNLESRNKQKYLKENAIEETSLISESFCLTVSTSSSQLGKIISCYGKIPPNLKIRKELLIGKSINTLMPVLYSKSHDYLIRSSHEKINLESAHNTDEVLILSQDNTIISSKIYLSLRNLIDHSLCFSVILRPIKNEKRLVLVGDNGLISNFSKEFANDMGIEPEEGKIYNVFAFCPDLRKVIDEFHIVSQKRVKEVVNRFKSPREVIKAKTLTSIKNKNIKSTEDSFSESKQNVSKFYTSVQTKETNLNFFPKLVNSDQGLSSPGKILVYQAEIRRVVIQNSQIFELKMTKLMVDDSRSLKNNRFFDFQQSPLSRKSSFDPSIRSPKKKISNMIPLNTQNSEDQKLGLSDDNLLITSPPRGDLTDSGSNLVSIPESNKEESKTNRLNGKDENLNVTQGKFGNNPPSNCHIQDQQAPSDPTEFENKRELASRILPEYRQIEKNIKKEFFGERFFDENINNKYEEAHGIIKEVIESRKEKRLTRNYYLILVATLIYFFGFLVWLNVYISATSKKIEVLSQVLKETYFRNYWTNIAHQETRIWVAKRKRYVSSSIAQTIASNNYTYQRLNYMNQNLRMSVSSLEYELQALFNEKQVNIYNRGSYENLEFISIDNIFEATDKILIKGLRNVNKEKPDVLVRDSINEETRFIFDNSCSDLLTSSNKIATMVRDILFSKLDESRATMKLFLIITLLVLVLFVLFSFYFMIITNREANLFMQIIFSLSLIEVQKVEKLLGKLRALLEKDSNRLEFLRTLHLTPTNTPRKDTSIVSGNTTTKRVGFREASMSKFYVRNYLTFGGLFISLGLIIAFILYYYYRAVGKTDIMKKQHNSIDNALRYINTLTITSVEIQTLIMENNTVNIRNIPVFDALVEDIESFKSVYNFQKNLMDDKGALPAQQQEIFFNMSCDKMYSPLYSIAKESVARSCVNKSQGLGRIGLVNILSQLATDLTQLYSDYRTTVGTESSIKTFYSRFFNSILASINVSATLLLMSFTSLTEDFQNLVLELESNRILLGWIAALVTAVLGGLTWIFIGKKSLKREFERNKVLSLIPKKLIFSNYRLKMYVAGLASDIGHNLKDLL